VTAEQVIEMIAAIREAKPTEDSRQAAVRATRIWTLIKNAGRDLLAFVIRTAIEVFK
jgi:hypothetical protein